MPRAREDLYVPAAPLLAYVGSELASFVPNGTQLHSRAGKTLSRARRQGRLSADVADFFCVRVLGVHPVEVFGDDWWTTVDEGDVA